jgi:hypothetical protein
LVHAFTINSKASINEPGIYSSTDIDKALAFSRG